ncbi:MAG: hypothetical protein GXO26_09015 [Crenarchaeota archaeon]|nr:hypothetical protein [Thermoproteota archaeon]
MRPAERRHRGEKSKKRSGSGNHGSRGIAISVETILITVVCLAVALAIITLLLKYGAIGAQVKNFIIQDAELTTSSFSCDIVNTGTVAIKSIRVKVYDLADPKKDIVYDSGWIDLQAKLHIVLNRGQTLSIRCTPAVGGSTGTVKCQWCIGGQCAIIGKLDTSKIYPGDTYRVAVEVKYTTGQYDYHKADVIAQS